MPNCQFYPLFAKVVKFVKEWRILIKTSRKLVRNFDICKYCLLKHEFYHLKMSQEEQEM